ncbi:MAG: hypothetical protein R2718_13630 [Solirubrobacterales bacterium]
MTEQAVPATPTRPPARPAGAARKKPGAMPTVLLALATFAVIFEFLAFQLNNGNDPALGKSALAANDPKAAKVARPVVNRRIVKTRVVHLPPKQSATSSAVPVSSSGSSGSSSAASTVTSSAPAPAPAAAPAPAPAPVTSSS